MGYYTNFKIEASKDQGEHIEQISKLADLEYDGTEWSVGEKWYDREQDMILYSKGYPDIEFKIWGIGEERGDEWIEYYKNGEVKRVDGEMVFDEPVTNKVVISLHSSGGSMWEAVEPIESWTVDPEDASEIVEWFNSLPNIDTREVELFISNIPTPTDQETTKEQILKTLEESGYSTKYRVIIAGGREFNDSELLSTVLEEWIKESEYAYDEIKVLSGMANGADALGYQFAKDRNIEIEEYPAHWDLYGKSAGPVRNQDMANNADGLIAFWDGKSKGTKNMIEEAKRRNLDIKIVHY